MSIWKRGVNLVKGAIAEASKSDDPEKMRALDEEMKRFSPSKKNPRRVEDDISVKKPEETSEVNSQETPTFDPEKPLSPKKRTI
jgi:hypothetical protein